MASGIKCKKAPPNNTPADKETRVSNIFFKIFSFKVRVKIPIKEIRLRRKVLRMI